MTEEVEGKLVEVKILKKETKEELLKDGSYSAAICYTQRDWEKILNEPAERTESRIQGTLESGHHSVYEHRPISLYFERIPKILAMVLNNEKQYTTSEKSARYTKMKDLPEEEGERYSKWKGILEGVISERYPQIPPKQVSKLAMENARYMISVFTPTKMRYTTNLRQMNYILGWMDDYIQMSPDEKSFDPRLKQSMRSFINEFYDLKVLKMKSGKQRQLSLFTDNISKKRYFGDVYSTSYETSLASLAQAQRHRSLNYQMKLPKRPEKFFVPPILEDNEDLVKEWLEDIESVSDCWPQGTMVMVSEKGTLDNFLLKCWERLCGRAQLEIMNQTKETLQEYINNIDDEKMRGVLKLYDKGPRCTFPQAPICKDPCNFGKKALERKI